MTTSYPAGLDSYTNPTSTDELGTAIGTRTHSAMHADINDAMEAVQAELGTDPAGASATVKARFEALPALSETLTNKTINSSTINSFTNTVDADSIHLEVRNDSGSTIAKGVPVYISGYNVGLDLATIAPADASVSGTMPAIGITEESINNNASGAVVRVGRLSGVATNAFSVGAELFVSETTGALTATRPSSPALSQVVATVLRSHATLGVLEIQSSTDVQAYAADALKRMIRIVLDGGGSAITTGAKKVYVSVPWDCTITKARLLADVSGAIVVDVWQDTYANFPPTNDDSITASAPPTITASGVKSEDSTLTGWDTTLDEGSVLEVNVDSCTSITKCYLDLFVTI